MKKNDIEDLFKDSFKDFEAEVSPGVWSNIQTALKGVGIGLLGKALLNKVGTSTIVAVVSSAAAVISTVVIMNMGGKTETKTAETKTAPKQEVEKTRPLAPHEIKEFLRDENENSNKSENNTITEIKPGSEKESKEQKEDTKTDIHIKKEKMNEVIKEFSDQKIASIIAAPIGGTVPLIVNVSNRGTGKINKWSFGDGQKETGANPVHVYDVPGVYTLALTSTGPDGKTCTDSIKIEVYGNSSIPAAPMEFTPNGDGNIDIVTFKPINMVSQSLAIFDKNGKVYFKSESLEAKWDGTHLNGQKAKEGVYFYIQTAVGIDGKKYEQQGRINLTR
jgi:gliding motility-associated-like protein